MILNPVFSFTSRLLTKSLPTVLLVSLKNQTCQPFLFRAIIDLPNFFLLSNLFTEI